MTPNSTSCKVIQMNSFVSEWKNDSNSFLNPAIDTLRRRPRHVLLNAFNLEQYMPGSTMCTVSIARQISSIVQLLSSIVLRISLVSGIVVS